MRAFADKLSRLAIEEDLGKVAPASRMKFRAWDDLVVQEDSPSYEAPEGLVSVLLRVYGVRFLFRLGCLVSETPP